MYFVGKKERVRDMIPPQTAQKSPHDNNFYEHALNSMLRFQAIYEGTVPYISDDFAMLINTLERLYKGFLQYQLDTNPNFSLQKGFLTNDHDLLKLTKKIEQFLPLFECKTNEERADKNMFFKELRRKYTQARYTEMVPEADFKELYLFVEKQMKRMESYFEKERQLLEHEAEYALDY